MANDGKTPAQRQLEIEIRKAQMNHLHATFVVTVTTDGTVTLHKGQIIRRDRSIDKGKRR